MGTDELEDHDCEIEAVETATRPDYWGRIEVTVTCGVCGHVIRVYQTSIM
jgi:hypothetical protein